MWEKNKGYVCKYINYKWKTNGETLNNRQKKGSNERETRKFSSLRGSLESKNM